MAPTINKLLTLPWRLRVASLDTHPPNHCSFLSAYPDSGKKKGDAVLIHNPNNEKETALVRLYPDHCIQGTEGAEFISEFDTSKLDHVVRKGYDARVEQYSAFRDTCFSDPIVVKSELLDLLVDAEVDTVFVGGLAANVCVMETAVHAVHHGFTTTVLSDCTRSLDQTQAGLKILADNFTSRGIRFQSSEKAGLSV